MDGKIYIGVRLASDIIKDRIASWKEELKKPGANTYTIGEIINELQKIVVVLKTPRNR
jgi:hypothetical protein